MIVALRERPVLDSNNHFQTKASVSERNRHPIGPTVGREAIGAMAALIDGRSDRWPGEMCGSMSAGIASDT